MKNSEEPGSCSYKETEMDANTGTHFTDAFGIESEVLEEYGAFNVSLISDLPLFIPFPTFQQRKE